MKKLTYGMVGGGPGSFIGDAHRRAIGLDGLAELTAGCFSRKVEQTRKTGEQLGLAMERCYNDYKAMAKAEALRQDGIDFVVVVTPNVSHYSICREFLLAGIHVVCDKPLCLTSEQAEELCNLANKLNLLFMVTYTYMGYVAVKHIRQIVRDGELGKIRTIMAEYPQGWLAHRDDCGGKQGEWRCDPAQSGGVNCLGDLGTHIENAVATMTGLKLKRVLAKLDVVVPGRVLDDNDVVLVEYEGGATGVYWSSQIALGHDNDLRIRIYGEEGSVCWSQEQPDKFIVIRKDGTRVEMRRGCDGIREEAAGYARLPAGHPEGWFEAMGNLYRAYIACVSAWKEGSFLPEMIDFPTAADGAAGVRFVEACLKSSKTGNCWVDVL